MKGARPLRSTRRLTNLQGRPDWYSIKNQADTTAPVLVHIYDEIGYWGVSANDFLKDLATHPGDIELHINSPGGDIFDGIAIYNTLKQRSGLVSVVIDGLAASAASFIAQAAQPDSLFISPHAQMMIHDGFAMAIGNAADLRDTAELLDKASDNIAAIYAERTGRDASYWRDLMRAETWYNDQEAVDAGLADAIHGVQGQTNGWDLRVFNAYRLRGAASHPPYTGTHTHSHPAHGGPDGDAGNHEHEHAHQGDASHDHHQEPDGDEPGSNSLRQLILNAEVDESAWDADRAMREAGQGDSPSKTFAKICAGRREGPSDQRDTWALPHHYPDKTAPNANGVRNALARLGSTKGLTNEEAARKHLESHMKVINPDWEPDGASDLELLMAQVQEALK